MVNRYTQSPVALYNPLDMSELAFAPSFLRQRHDQVAGQLGDIETASGQYDVLNDYQNVAGELVDPLQRGIQELANNLATQGVSRSNAVPQALKLKSQYSNLFGQNGAIGQLEGATKQYRAQAQQIQEFFKDAPELAQYVTSQLRPGEATLGANGKVQLGQMTNPTYVKDIPEAEILESLNDAASKLKASDLGDYGLQGSVRVGDFDEIVTLASGEGVTAQRAFDLITNLVGQEQMNSLYQRGRMQGLSPEEVQQNFLNKIKGVASSNAYQNIDRDRYKVTDELGLDRAKNMASIEEGDIFAIPGGRIEAANVNPFKNLTIKNGTVQSKEVPFDSGPYGRSAGGQSTPQGGFKLGPDGKIIRPTEESIRTEKTQAQLEFEELKRNTPELSGLSDKEALDKVNSYYENITQRYGAVVAPNPQQAKYLADNILNSLHTRSVYGPNGVGGTQEGLYESLGYENVRDFEEEGKPYLLGMRKMGPNGSTVYEFGITNKKGDKTSFYTSADELTNAYTNRSSDLGTMVMSGVSISPSYKMVQSDQGDPTLSLDINPIGTSSDPYKLYLTTPGNAFGNTPEEQFEHIRQTLKGKNASEAKRILTKQYNIPEEAFKVETMSDIAKEEDSLILKRLGSYWSNKQR